MKKEDPLLAAASAGQADVVKKLLARGAKLTATDSWNHTALHETAIDGHVEVASLLLAKGLDPNARNKSGATPLFMAAEMFAGPAYVRLLLDHGADVSVRTKKGETLIDGIFGRDLDKKKLAVARLLLTHGAPATPEQVKKIGGVESEAARLRAKLDAFDWPALEAHLFAATTKAIAAFAKRHADEEFYGFCYDCNASYGQVLFCLNTPERLQRYEEERRQREHPRSALDGKWSPGNWVYQEFASTDRDKRWSARLKPLADDGMFEREPADRMLESIARVACRLLDAGAFAPLRRTNDFDVFVRDHDEDFASAEARMRRARTAGGTDRKKAEKAKAGKAKAGKAKGKAADALNPSSSARATKGGSPPVARKQRFELVRGGSRKFWQLELRGSSHVVTFGKIGTAGQTREKSFATADAARADAAKLVKEKTSKGYKRT